MASGKARLFGFGRAFMLGGESLDLD